MHLGLSHPGPSEPIWPTEPAVSLEELDRIASKLDQNLIIWREDSEAIARAAQYLKAFWRSRHPDVAVKQFRGDQRLALLTHINQLYQHGWEHMCLGRMGGKAFHCSGE